MSCDYALMSPDNALPLPSQEVAAQVPQAYDSSDSELDSSDEGCCPWYGVRAGAAKLPVPAQDFSRKRNGHSSQLVTSTSFPDHAPVHCWKVAHSTTVCHACMTLGEL